jgi:DNA-binding NtrC family response regulator
MVVDDESFVLSMLGEVLTEYGYRRRLFRSAHQALAFFREYFTEIDLVILDMRMPAMSGHDLFYALRKINPYCRVLIMSGYDDSQDIRTLQNDGARGFLPKPFSRDACAAAIKDALA